MIQNPILRGFSPDASACQVGGDYYIATSTFEWWPGICIYHSKDLANWELVSHPVKKMNFLGDESSGGLWAPHLSHADGKFWLVVTDVRTRTQFKDTLNYIITCETINGEWSEPVFVNASGFDPALFHDDDGRKYFLNMLWDYRPGHNGFAGMVMQEYDAKIKKLVGERKHIFYGTDLGVAEGPQILKKDGWYYLLSAAGGTGYNHASVVARSKSIWGEYEISPYHPLITTMLYPENPLQKSGHACFLQAGDEWYITHICARPLTQRGNCTLGRETSLQKIEWVDSWPHLANGTNQPALLVRNPRMMPDTVQQLDQSTYTDFEKPELPLYFQALRAPLEEAISLTARPGWLRLYGRESIASIHNQSLIARRWEHFSFRAQTSMDFSPKNFQQLAGLTCFYNTENFMYSYLTRQPDNDKKTLNLMVCEHGKFRMETENIEIPEMNQTLFLAVDVDRDRLQFSYSTDQHNWSLLGGELPADHLSDDYIEKSKLVFTGSMVGVCCQDLCDRTAYADFDDFTYKEKHCEEENQ